jgi:hypothetical protein
MRHKLDLRDIWETIAREAERESPLWRASLLASDDRDAVPVFSTLAEERFSLGLETIYEGYLLHYGRPRLFGPTDRDLCVLLGDYLYAHGLVRIARLGEVAVVADLAELISVCAQLRADGAGSEAWAEGRLWAATAALLGSDDPRLAAARHALSEHGDSEPLAHIAANEAHEPALELALSLHHERVA